MACGVNRQSIRDVIATASQIGEIDEALTVSGQFGYKGIAGDTAAREIRLESTGASVWIKLRG